LSWIGDKIEKNLGGMGIMSSKKLIYLLVLSFILISGCSSNQPALEQNQSIQLKSEQNVLTQKDKLIELLNRYDKDKLIFATYPNFEPFEYYDNETNKFMGFDIDLINAISEITKIDIEIESIPFGQLIKSVENQEVDAAISAMQITGERMAYVDFTDPYFIDGICIIIRKDQTSINNFENLSGKKVAILKSIYDNNPTKDLLSKINADGKEYSSINDICRNLDSGNLDALCEYYGFHSYYIQKNNLNFKIVNDSLKNKLHFGIAVSKQNKETLEILNQSLKALYESGQYQEIYTKWFGNDVQLGIPQQE